MQPNYKNRNTKKKRARFDPHRKEKRNQFNLGIFLGCLSTIIIPIVAGTLAPNAPGIPILVCYAILISVLVINRQFEILKGFILGMLIIPFILLGTCLGILAIISMFAR